MSNRKKPTNKELMSEIVYLRGVLDTCFMTVINYIEFKGDTAKYKKHLQNNKESDNVQSEL